MSDSNTIKQLRNEVQLLRDELAIMKRKYEDILYNLDTDNFSQRVVKQGKDMYTKIEQTAGEISLQAEKVGENTKNLAKLSVTAKEIQSAVFEENEDGTKTSRITQTAEKIESAVEEINTSVEGVETRLSTQIEQTNNQISLTATEVKKYAEDYVTDQLANGEYVTNATFKSQFDVYADGIYSEVSKTYETKSDANSSYDYLSDNIDTLNSYISSVSQTATKISSRVGRVESGQYTQNGETYTLFEQTADKFTFVGNVEISGDSIIGGTIVGSALKNSGETHTLKMIDDNGSGYGTFCLYNQYYNYNGGVPYFSVQDDTLGGIGLKGAGVTFLTAKASGGITVTPKGTWDFSGCTPIGLDGGTGGYAVFG